MFEHIVPKNAGIFPTEGKDIFYQSQAEANTRLVFLWELLSPRELYNKDKTNSAPGLLFKIMKLLFPLM